MLPRFAFLSVLADALVLLTGLAGASALFEMEFSVALDVSGAVEVAGPVVTVGCAG